MLTGVEHLSSINTSLLELRSVSKFRTTAHCSWVDKGSRVVGLPEFDRSHCPRCSAEFVSDSVFAATTGSADQLLGQPKGSAKLLRMIVALPRLWKAGRTRLSGAIEGHHVQFFEMLVQRVAGLRHSCSPP